MLCRLRWTNIEQEKRKWLVSGVLWWDSSPLVMCMHTERLYDHSGHVWRWCSHCFRQPFRKHCQTHLSHKVWTPCLLYCMFETLSLSCSFQNSTLPELIELKARIDMHTNIATALLDEIKVGRRYCRLEYVCLLVPRVESWICSLKWRTRWFPSHQWYTYSAFYPDCQLKFLESSITSFIILLQDKSVMDIITDPSGKSESVVCVSYTSSSLP